MRKPNLIAFCYFLERMKDRFDTDLKAKNEQLELQIAQLTNQVSSLMAALNPSDTSQAQARRSLSLPPLSLSPSMCCPL